VRFEADGFLAPALYLTVTPFALAAFAAFALPFFEYE
jgi:hypothetical protein